MLIPLQSCDKSFNILNRNKKRAFSAQRYKKKSLYIRLFLARVAGFEPANDGIRIRCLTAWRYPIMKFFREFPSLETRVAGFEPANDGIRIRCLTAWRYPII